MNPDDFDVSVVIPLYNHERYIGAGLDSVLAQSLAAREIILIDDGSQDNGIAIARQRLAGHPRATVVAQDNAGAHTTINRCIAMATSRHIAVLNSDDQFKPWKLQRCAELWGLQPDLDLVFGHVALIDDDNRAVHSGETIDWLARSEAFLARCGRLDLALAYNNFATTTSNYVFTRDLWQRLGGFAALRYCHDLDFAFGALADGKVLYDSQTSHIDYRVHPTNTIKENVNRVRVEVAAVLASALHGGLLGNPGELCDASTLALFDFAMADKGRGNLIPFLSARRSAFTARDDFYRWAIGERDINDALIEHLTGLTTAGHTPAGTLEHLYIGGRGAQATAKTPAPALRASPTFSAPPAFATPPTFATPPAFATPPPVPAQPANPPPLAKIIPPPPAATASDYSLASLLPALPPRRARAKPTLGFAGPAVIELASFDRGGLEKVVLDTAVVLREHGLDSIIVSCGKVGHLGEIARAQGFTVYELSSTDPQGDYRRILRQHGVTLAISHFSRTGYPVFAELGIPNVTFIHNVYAFLNAEPLANFIADDRYVDTYISVSPKATDYAATRLKIPRDKIVTVPNGLVIDEHIARTRAATPVTRAELGIRPDDYVFLNVASYNLHKNHYLMAEAMQMVLKKTDRIRILCIGNTIVPHHIAGLRHHLDQLGVSDHMLMPGYFADVAPFHAIADAFLLPSLIEGWSIAMNEAMFFGKPMLLSDTGGASEVIHDNDIGILLPNEYGDVSNLHSELLDDIGYNRRHFRTSAYLAQAMMVFAENRDYWRQAGKQGTRRVLDHYDFTDVVTSYFPIFEATVRRHRP